MELSNSIHALTCFIGCAWFTFITILEYFKYETITNQLYEFEVKIKPVVLDICTDLDGSIDDNILKEYENITAKYPIDSHQDYSSKYQNIYEHLTPQKIFDLSENVTIALKSGQSLQHYLLKSCYVRGKNTRSSNNYNEKECSQYFKIRKYLVSEWFCLMVEPTSRMADEIPVQNAITSGFGIIYQLKLRDSFKKHTYFKPVIHTGNHVPIVSPQYASYAKVKQAAMSTRFALKYQVFKLITLGTPYSKYTCATDSQEFLRCVRNCTLSRTLDKYGKIMFNYPLEEFMDQEIIRSPSKSKARYWKLLDQKFFNYNMSNNSTISKEMDVIDEVCQYACQMRSCNDDYCLTSFSTEQYPDLAFRVDLPSAPTVWITVVPRVTLLETIVYVLSTLGTWFGLVLIDCNPIQLLQRLYKFVTEKVTKLTDSRRFHPSVTPMRSPRCQCMLKSEIVVFREVLQDDF